MQTSKPTAKSFASYSVSERINGNIPVNASERVQCLNVLVVRIEADQFFLRSAGKDMEFAICHEAGYRNRSQTSIDQPVPGRCLVIIAVAGKRNASRVMNVHIRLRRLFDLRKFRKQIRMDRLH